MKSPFEIQGGARKWFHKPGDKYIVAGVLYSGTRFRDEYSDWKTAFSINVWRGSKWLLRDGRRYLIQRITN